MEENFDTLGYPIVRLDFLMIPWILKMERYRGDQLPSTVPPQWFSQLKKFYRVMEAVQSANVAGNSISVSDYMAREQMPEAVRNSEVFREIENLEKALCFIEETPRDRKIDKEYICELQKMVVNGLVTDGVLNADGYRKEKVLTGSSLVDAEPVPDLMEDLINFINLEDGAQYDLLKIAMVYHRFEWIHPFMDGNGRTARLLVYAMFYRLFAYDRPSLFVVTSVLYANRKKYDELIAFANSDVYDGVLSWSEYVIQGFVERYGKLLDFTKMDFVRNEILDPMLSEAKKRNMLVGKDEAALKIILDKLEFQASDLQKIWKDQFDRSRNIRRLVETGFIKPVKDGGRRYVLNFAELPLSKCLLKVLQDKDCAFSLS